MAMILFAFDCDGTLNVSGGPVAISILTALTALGHKVVIVSPSAACKPLGFTHVDSADRLVNLKRVKELYPECERWVYVSDNAGDPELAAQAGFEYVHPSNFGEVLRPLLPL